jgi:transposase
LRRARFILSDEERAALEHLARADATARALAQRARIVLACTAQGANDRGVARALGVSRPTVAASRRRFAEHGIAGLKDRPRTGAPRRIAEADVDRVIELTLDTPPPYAAGWTTRSVAKRVGISQTAVSRIWRAMAPPPCPERVLGPFGDPLLAATVRDVAGIYMDPLNRVLALTLDTRRRRQAAYVVASPRGQVEEQAHARMRQGTFELLASLEARLTWSGRPRGATLLVFLDQIDWSVPADFELCFAVADGPGSSGVTVLRHWLARRSRGRLHLVEDGARWLAFVGWWLWALTARQLKQGMRRATWPLERSIQRFVAAGDAADQPFIWV